MPTASNFKKSPYYADAVFIGSDYYNAETKIIEGGKIIMLHSNNKYFEVDIWFDLLIFAFGLNSDTLKSEDDKISYLSEARNNCVQLIEAIKVMMNTAKGLCKNYELDYVITKMDALLAMAKTKVEGKLLVSQLQTNANTKGTNNLNKLLFGATTLFAFLAVIVSYLGYDVANKQYKRDLKKDDREQELSKLKQQLEAEQLEISKRNYIIDSLTFLLMKPPKNSVQVQSLAKPKVRNKEGKDMK